MGSDVVSEQSESDETDEEVLQRGREGEIHEFSSATSECGFIRTLFALLNQSTALHCTVLPLYTALL